MVQLGWQNDELISDRWARIEDQPAVKVMQLVKQEEDPESGKDKRVMKENKKSPIISPDLQWQKRSLKRHELCSDLNKKSGRKPY